MKTAGAVRRVLLITTVLAASLTLFSPAGAEAEQIPPGWKASNMKPIAYSDMNGHAPFKMVIRQVNGRWYLYTGHLWDRGWSIVDVTDPANPKYVKFIPGPPNTWTIQVDLHDNLMITALQPFPVAWGYDPKKPHEEGILLWDISDPVNPKQLSHWSTGAGGTHRNWYPGGKYAYLAASMPGYKGQILVILDVSDPAHPKEAGRWWMPGQKEGEPPWKPFPGHPENPNFHGPAFIEGNRAYLGYTPALIILDISDVAHPKQVGRLDFSPPFSSIVVHDAMKIPGKPLVFVHSEGQGGDTRPDDPQRRPDDLQACEWSVPLVGMVDVSHETQPRFMSMFPVPHPPQDEPYTDFCDKGGRFGPHNTNLEQHLPDVEKQGDLIYLTYFNAGLRIFDIKDPRMPKEVGWFIPPAPTRRWGPIPYNLTQSSEDVLVDTRGYIYVSDKQWGLFILRYTGKGEPAPTAR